MQYPQEQQPLPQRSPAPSEIYIPEQPQSYAPQWPVYEQSQEVLQRAEPVQDIAIYPNRGQAIMRISILVVVLVLMIMILGLLVFVFSIGGFSADIVTMPLRWVFGVLLVCIAVYGWLIWRMVSSLLLTRNPLLLINREGITVGRMLMFSGFFIPWSEIEAISTYTFMYKYLCIIPRNPREFMKRFNAVERFIRWSNALFGIPRLIVPQVFLERPVAEILPQIYYQYVHELSYYRVQLRP
jgi:hypothetical protein